MNDSPQEIKEVGHLLIAKLDKAAGTAEMTALPLVEVRDTINDSARSAGQSMKACLSQTPGYAEGYEAIFGKKKKINEVPGNN